LLVEVYYLAGVLSCNAAYSTLKTTKKTLFSTNLYAYSRSA